MVHVELKGIRKVTANINKEVLKMKVKSLKGLIEAAIIIRRSMEQTAPLTPVDSGNLRASWFVVTAFTQPEGSSPNFTGEDSGELKSAHGTLTTKAKGVAAGKRIPLVVIGFSAFYATYVHEMVGATFQRPNAGAKFLEAALNRNRAAIIAAIKKSVKL